jgi:pyruvate dehydrogenase E1 component alpha subunit
MKISEERLKQIYLLMKRCRVFDERVREEYFKARIKGFAHVSVGEEAISAGVSCWLREDDYVLGSHRAHANTVAKGAQFDRLMAELFGKTTGYCKGKAGSLHMHAIEHNVLLCSGMVGSQTPVASGVALGSKKQGWDRVTVCYLGDGATNTSAFHEGVGMAAAFSLPVLFVCENNQYAMSNYWKDYMKITNIADRAKGYGIPGITVDGMDAIAVAEVAGEAIEKIRKGKGPIFIEALCYRFYGHACGLYADESFRSQDELEAWKKRDPIPHMYTVLSEMGLITEKEDKEMDLKLQQEIDQAVEFALKSPEPEIDEALVDLYC